LFAVSTPESRQASGSFLLVLLLEISGWQGFGGGGVPAVDEEGGVFFIADNIFFSATG
jgi:hypothetical protein